MLIYRVSSIFLRLRVLIIFITLIFFIDNLYGQFLDIAEPISITGKPRVSRNITGLVTEVTTASLSLNKNIEGAAVSFETI